MLWQGEGAELQSKDVQSEAAISTSKQSDKVVGVFGLWVNVREDLVGYDCVVGYVV